MIMLHGRKTEGRTATSDIIRMTGAMWTSFACLALTQSWDLVKEVLNYEKHQSSYTNLQAHTYMAIIQTFFFII